MAASPDQSIEVRAAGPADRGAVLEMLAASLGWLPHEQLAGFFAWKHDENPFGPLTRMGRARW